MNTDDPAGQIIDALRAGNKIEAIRLYREQTKLGLAESKAAVEKLEAELRTSSPDRFTQPQSKGCTTMILAVVVVSGMLYSLLR